MRPPFLPKDSLAARYTRLAALLALVTTLLLGATAAVGVYRIVRLEQQSRVRAYRDVLELEVSSHLQTAYHLTRSLAERQELRTGSPAQARLVLGVTLLDNGAYLAHLTLAKPDGSILAAYPASGTPSAAEIRLWGSELEKSYGRSEWIVSGSDARLVCWVSRPGEAERLLVARIQTERITSTIEQIASTSRRPVVLVVDEQGSAIISGGDISLGDSPKLEISRPDSQGMSEVSLAVAGGQRYEGYGGRVRGVPGIEWALVVLEPAQAAAADTWGALRPAIIVYVVVLLVIIVVAMVAFSWLVKPLRLLEARARAIAQGASLEPVAVSRGDEVGRLLDSFNLVTMRLNRLQEAAHVLARTDDPEEVAENIIRSVVHLIGSCDAAVFIMERFGDCGTCSVRVAEARGAVEAWIGRSIEVREGPLKDSLDAGEVRQVPIGLDEVIAGVRGEEGARSTVLVPLRVLAETVGLIAVSRSAERSFSAAEVELIKSFAAQAALALERARLFVDATQRAASLETVFRISQAVSSSLQVNVVLGRVLDVVQKILSADAVVLLQWSPEKKALQVPMARGSVDRDLLEARFAPVGNVPGSVLVTQQPMVIADLEGMDDPFAARVRRKGMRSALLVPLVARGRAIGVLATLDSEPDKFDQADAELLSTFASHAALAIDTAELFGREHRVAKVLQESILPTKLVEIDGLEMDAVYVPAGGEADIGGDYYDVFTAPDGRVVLVMGDVCGKGIEAATKTSMIRYTVRGMVAAGANPAQILETLNGMIVDTGEPTDIFTIWLGMLDVKTGALEWADGGHPPALVLRAGSNRILRLGTTGPLVGAIAAVPYACERVTLEHGDCLLLYTDGVSEARCEGRLFGEGRLRRILRRAKRPRVVARALLEALERYTGNNLRDDVAVLAVALSDSAPV